jgi:hypothetical protein
MGGNKLQKRDIIQDVFNYTIDIARKWSPCKRAFGRVGLVNAMAIFCGVTDEACPSKYLICHVIMAQRSRQHLSSGCFAGFAAGFRKPHLKAGGAIR